MSFLRLYVWFVGKAFALATDDLLVIVGLKWRPVSGPARWS